MTEQKRFFSPISNKTYLLQQEPFAVGGEGSIYSVVENENLAAKIFTHEKATSERKDKITTMMKVDPSRMQNFTWPIDILYDADKKFAGYVMQKVTGCEKLVNFYVFDNRDKYTWPLYITVARNLAAAVYNIHETGQIIGDLNPENVLCNVKSGIVTMVDTDSYHIIDQNGRVMRCEVGMPEFVAPELQGVYFPTAPADKSFTMYSDNFALAVLIFRLLMNGAHPFSCTRNAKSASSFQPVDNIKKGLCVYLRPREGFGIPVYAPDITCLPGDIRALFERAFIAGGHDPSVRPKSYEWYQALGKLESELTVCSENKKHFFYSGISECPWCKVRGKVEGLLGKSYSLQDQNQESKESIIEKSTSVSQQYINTKRKPFNVIVIWELMFFLFIVFIIVIIFSNG